jgi:hypothetical protein
MKNLVAISLVFGLSISQAAWAAKAVRPKHVHARASVLTEETPPAAVQKFLGANFTYLQIAGVKSFAVNTNAPKPKRQIDFYVGAQSGSAWLNGNSLSQLLSVELPKALQVFAACDLGFANVHMFVFKYTSEGLHQLNHYADSSPYDPPFEFPLYKDLPPAL